MKKIFILSIILLLNYCLQAQVIIGLRLPPEGLVIKPQLWNLSLINTGAQEINVRIEMVMTDVTDNRRVLTGTSRLMVLPKGPKQIQISDVLPVTYNMGNAGYHIDPSPEGFLPIGVFNICYSIIKVGSDDTEQLGEECETVEVEPISPPQLVLPPDEEAVEISRPFFTWLPPAPYNSLNTLSYDWILVEVQPTQSPADAIQQNVPVLLQKSIGFTAFQYPLSLPELDSSKRYAWRVTAMNNFKSIANSEIWSFKVKKQSVDTVAGKGEGYYARLQRTENAAYIICNGVLRFEYLNEYNSHAVQLSILDISNDRRKQIALDSSEHSIRPGQNFMAVDLRETTGMLNRHIYLLELINARKEKWYLKFEYRK